MKGKKFLFVPTSAAALILAVAATAWACTTFNGTFSVTGNATGGGTVTCTGLGPNMAQACDTGIAKATGSGGSITVSVGKTSIGGVVNNQLPPATYGIYYYNSPAGNPANSGFAGHTLYNTDCMYGNNGAVTVGSITVSAAGTGGGTFPLPASTADALSPVLESSVCVSNASNFYGNEAPLTIV